MRYGSVCSGIEAATVAWHPLGWEAAWYSEIEPFPCAVLKHHYPAVPNYGDMTKYEEWFDEPINLLVGGTPCQSFSVAGLRKGLADPRGNLMLTYGAIARRYRPEWLVWENVPGVLSSNGGRDFGTFLGMLAELGYGFAYRVLDAQYFGVAQRRRRVFVVANARSWQRAAAVLFECHSLQGHPAPSREAGKDAAKCLTAGVEKRFDPTSESFSLAPTLQANDGAKWGSNQWVDEGKAIIRPVAETLLATDHKGPNHNRDHNFIAQPIAWDGEFNPSVNVAGTLLRGGQGGRQEGVAQPMAFPWQSALDPIGNPENLSGTLIKNQTMAVAFSAGNTSNAYGLGITVEGTPPLRAGASGTNQVPTVAHSTVQAYEWHNQDSRITPVSVAATLNCNAGGKEGHLVQPMAFEPGSVARNAGPAGESALAPTLRREMGDNQPAIRYGMQVRRLTPVECERLQGFPDGYTDIPWRGKPNSPDGPRYKAMGNSMAVPVMRWIGERIKAVDAL